MLEDDRGSGLKALGTRINAERSDATNVPNTNNYVEDMIDDYCTY